MPDEPTTPEVAGLMRRLFDATKALDIGAAVRLFAPDGVWEMGIGTFEGRTAIRDLIEQWIGTYEEYAIELEEVRDLGGGVTFSVAVQTGRPLGSSGISACASRKSRYGLTARSSDS